jgi:hypothetical protein
MSNPEQKLKLTPEQVEEITQGLVEKFKYYQDLREPIDNDIRDDVDLYNNIDKSQDSYEEWMAKAKVPYVYTVTQTATARVCKSLFGQDNYVRCYTEGLGYSPESERAMSQFVQDEMEVIGLSSRARDFIEESAVKRTSWLHIRPRKGIRAQGEGIWTVDFDILDWFSVWFDTRARTTDETDFFIRKTKRLHKLIENKDGVYFNTELVADTTLPDTINFDSYYKAQHSGQRTVQYTQDNTSATRPIELLEFYGEWNLGTEEKPEWKEVIFTMANRSVLVRAELNTMPTRKKRLIFPIRVFRQANSLIGKSIVQLVRDKQINLNELISLRMHNARLLAKLMFKYKRGAGIDWAELYSGAGNAVGYDDSPNDIDLFQIQNLLGPLTGIADAEKVDMQQVTGATDYVMGTNVDRGASETATTSRLMTEQSMYKFGMMVDNVKDDLCQFMLYVAIVKILFDKNSIELMYPDIKQFTMLPATALEENRYFDINVTDLSQRRDVERTQFINAANIIGNLLQNAGGDMTAFLKEIMTKLKMDNVDNIIQPNPEMQQAITVVKAMAQNPAAAQIIQAVMAQPALAQKLAVMVQAGNGATGVPASSGQSNGGGQGVQPTAESPESQAAQVNAQQGA